ncbi:hypothetical protein BV98_001475 [Sphingobium herbicidovorans NBRC 16415]|uniref:Uncharacterized protein n=1 Tax=Sphingobium herbicidovorans (strain ATCC 700291 / DSM 11019 / CCUG 56400 / KCTC 2939 / LMG 18315 / NBRC 16415 / MH) TaxID=1219045 RepID=A0A086PBJ5_SPHHM|nr:hypothetical protein [Sphingobium herbicidovorans]KFG90763.1 hypothetical protein BV98_001475 [Sphingobium herbicidovorans NBRC 16415]
MNAPARINKARDPALIAFVEALARAQVARDIAALRAARGGGLNGDSDADGHLRPVQQ